jgi:YHS domain-containing protein
MEANQAKAKAAGLTSEFRGQIYYFCANEYKVKFDQEPTRYAGTPGNGPATPAGKRLSEAQWKGGPRRKRNPPRSATFNRPPPLPASRVPNRPS